MIRVKPNKNQTGQKSERHLIAKRTSLGRIWVAVQPIESPPRNEIAVAINRDFNYTTWLNRWMNQHYSGSNVVDGSGFL